MQRFFKITVNGKEYDVTVDELSVGASMMPNYLGTPLMSPASSQVSAPATAYAPAPAAAPVAGSGDQCAQMGGVVSAILVKEGQSVAEGEKVAELEAMKMKVPLMASCAGKVTKIHAAEGDAVSAGQPVLTIS